VRTSPGHESAGPESATDAFIDRENASVAHNYHSLPVVITEGEGCWVTDVAGRRYLDCLAAYSALAFGHRPPDLIALAHQQLDRLTLSSRAFHHDRLAEFGAGLAALCGAEMTLPANTGVEAVEAALKVARKWGYERKGVPADAATIVVAENNFHGRTISVISFSTDPLARRGFGPFTPGFRMVPFGDAAALDEAIDDATVAVLIEPIQGEAGVIVPPDGYLGEVRRLCDANDVLFIADEIQSGLGRTGATFACDHEGVRPDLFVLGKALGAGIMPVSAVVGNRDVLGVLRPGQHGSTFGGNPLACAIGCRVVELMRTGTYQLRARTLGRRMHDRLATLLGAGVVGLRSRGLWAGIDIDPALATGRLVCERLLARGVLAKDTHGSTIRLSPPLIIEADEIDWAVEQIGTVLAELAGAVSR
jgi:ornithine--oxo-acid transaminase